MIGRFIGRYPGTVTTLILGILAVSIWQATVYVETVVRPREAAERKAMIAHEIDRADRLFARTDYETALTEYEYVLAGFIDELTTETERRLRGRVGTCLVELASAGHAKGSFERGIESYQAALDLSPDGLTRARSLIANRIGDAYLLQSRVTSDPSHAMAAIGAFEEGLSNLSEESDAGLYATGLRLIGNAHRRLHEMDPDGNPMENAMQSYQEALRLASPLQAPIARGETLEDIGRAHVLLSERGYRRRELQEAVKTYERALAIFTVEDFPKRHAAAHKELGDAYMLLAELGPRNRSDRAAHLQRVLRYQNKAKQSYRIAKSFGFEPGFFVASAEAEPIPVEDEKKE